MSDTTTSSRSSADVTAELELFELKPGKRVSLAVLKLIAPDAMTAIFIGKAYGLDYQELSSLLRALFKTTVVQALLSEGDLHSSDLQSYIIDVVPAPELQSAGIYPAQFTSPVTSEILPELWEQLDVEIADSIKKLVESLGTALELVQSKHGTMLFSALAKLNKQRQGVIGSFEAQVKHKLVEKNLVVFDVSGSVTEETAHKIVDEVVALAYKANAALAIVSNHTFVWEPGTFNSELVMSKAEFQGTHYETLAQVFNEDWATVITVADYDSAWVARDYLRDNCTGRVQQVLDISLVNKPTFLAECIGLLADNVRPLLIGNSSFVLGSEAYDNYAGNPDYDNGYVDSAYLS